MALERLGAFAVYSAAVAKLEVSLWRTLRQRRSIAGVYRLLEHRE